MARQAPHRQRPTIQAYDERFAREKRRRRYWTVALILLLLSLMFFALLRIWQRRPQPRFMFLREEYLAEEINVDALIIRDETVYKAPVGGVFRSFVAQGSKVAKASKIGQIVPADDLDELRKLDKANNDVNDRRYELLAEGKGGNAGRVFEAGEEAIRRNIKVLYDNLLAGELPKIAEIEMELRLIMDQRVEDAQIFQFDDEELSRLISLRDSLEQSAFHYIRDIHSEASGIFIRQVDGLEVELTPERALSMSASDLKRYLAEVKPLSLIEEVEQGDPLYKLSRSPNQYFICLVPHEYMNALTDLFNNERVRVYSSANGVNIERAELIRQEATASGNILVFRTNHNLEAFATMRRTPLTLFVNEAKGLRVPKSALIDYKDGNLEAKLKLVDGGYVHQVTVKIVGSNQEYVLIEGVDGSPYDIEVATMILLNPYSMEEGDSIAGP